MTYDEYGDVTNSEDTYKAIAEELGGNAVTIGWTDQNSTHLDILFTYKSLWYGGNIQGGIRPRGDLFVSIMRVGSFAFDIKNTDTHWSYYSEKLGYNTGEITGKALADLINGVKKELLLALNNNNEIKL